MQHSPVLRRLSVVAVLALAAACGGGDSPSGPNPPPTPVPPTPSPSPDTQAPTVSYVSPAADTTVAQAGVTVQGRASDNVGVTRVTYALDNGSEQDVTITAGTSVTFQFTVQGLAEGNHTLVLRSYDAAANRAEAQRGITFVRPVSYGVTSVQLLPGTVGGTPSGLAAGPNLVGYAQDAQGRRAPFFWKGGQLSALPLLPNHITGQAISVNAGGQAAGYSSTSTDAVVEAGETFRAVLWEGGQARDLGDLGGGIAVARGINAAGVVVGASTSTASGVITFRPFLWENGSMSALPTLGGDGGFATGINDAKQVVGGALDGSGRTRAFLWQNGTIIDLGSSTSDGESTANAINSAGQVVGYSGVTGSSPRAFLWQNGTLTDLGSQLAAENSIANGINASGAIVGIRSSGGVVSAFLLSNGTAIDLNAVLAPGSGFTIVSAVGINDAGQIAAEGVTAGGEHHALVLTPSGGASASAYRVQDAGPLRGANRARPLGGFAAPGVPMLLRGVRLK